jgi:hypothetical protein
MFDAVGEPVSAPRAELFTYASRSATRCSSDGGAEGDDVCACSGEKSARIPISKKIRIITRSRYSARIYHGKENGVVLPTH